MENVPMWTAHGECILQSSGFSGSVIVVLAKVLHGSRFLKEGDLIQ